MAISPFNTCWSSSSRLIRSGDTGDSRRWTDPLMVAAGGYGTGDSDRPPRATVSIWFRKCLSLRSPRSPAAQLPYHSSLSISFSLSFLPITLIVYSIWNGSGHILYFSPAQYLFLCFYINKIKYKYTYGITFVYSISEISFKFWQMWLYINLIDKKHLKISKRINIRGLESIWYTRIVH